MTEQFAAPGLRWRERKDGTLIALWIARSDLTKKGFRPSSARLWSGKKVDEATRRWISDECDRMTAQMKAWAVAGKFEARQWNGTLGALIDLYQTDPHSSYRKVRPSTRAGYDHDLAVLARSVGHATLTAITGRAISEWHALWRQPAESGGKPRVRRAHGLVTMLRMLASYGVAFGEDAVQTACLRLKAILENLRFETAPPRSGELTAEMAAAVIAAAHAQGRPSIALAQAMQFELALRQKDVIGEWVDMNEPGLSAVTDRRQKWLWGLRWEEIDDRLVLRHPLSKSNGRKVGEYDLRLYPMVAQEVTRLPQDKRSGPVVICEGTGLPYRRRHFAESWRAVAAAAGVPSDVFNMDSRAGATTETIEATDGNVEAARKQAGHSNSSTTLRYARGALRSNSATAAARAKHRTGPER